MAIHFLDLESGSDSNGGTNKADAVLTFARASSLVAAGDTIRVKADVGAVATSVNATWVNGGDRITLSGAVNAHVSECQAAWTAAASVTCTAVATRKYGWRGTQIAVAAGFTTGKAAYEAMTSTDFSGYQQISGYVMQTSGTLASAAQISLKLCSDTAGATPVDTMDLPAIHALNVWVPFVIDKAAALGAAIQSIALYINTDVAAQTFIFNNIVAVKASGNQDELHHKMLVGKQRSIGGGGADDETWYPIRWINGTSIGLDYSWSNQPGGASVALLNYAVPRCLLSSETATLYTYAPSYLPTSTTAADLMMNFGGTSGSHITISGGWNRTDMTTQTGHTIAASAVQNTIGVSVGGTHVDVERLHLARWEGQALWEVEALTTAAMHVIGHGNASVFGIISCNGDVVLSYSGCTSFTLQGTGLVATVSADSARGPSIGSGSTIVVAAGKVIVGNGLAGYVTAHNGTTYGGERYDDVQTVKGRDVSDPGGSVTWNTNVGTTQPVNHTGTGGSALVKGDALAINGSAAAAALQALMYAAAETGTAQAGGASSITLAADAPSVSLVDQAIWILSGTGAVQTNRISAYDTGTKVATVVTAWSTAPDNTSVYVVLGRTE